MQASRFHIHSSKHIHPLMMTIVVYSYDFHHVVSRNMEAVKEEKPPDNFSFHKTQVIFVLGKFWFANKFLVFVVDTLLAAVKINNCTSRMV